MLVICEIIVACHVCTEIVFTRLPVGHTHEDIDAKFGVLWVHFRLKPVLSPQQYEKEIKAAFNEGTNKLEVNVVDIFCVPDYKSFFTGKFLIYLILR